MTEPLRVGLHVGQLLQPVPGGIGRYATTLARHLPAAGAHPIAFAAGRRPPQLSPGCDYVDLGRPHGALRYEMWHRLRRPCLDLEVDVVHAPSLAVPPAGKRPLVVTVHDLAFRHVMETLTPRGVRFHERGFALARTEAKVIVAASQFTADELVATGVDRQRIVVAPHGIAPIPDRDDTDVDAALARAGVRPPFLLTVGTIEPRKQLTVAADALTFARRSEPELRLVIAGPQGWGHVGSLGRPGVIRLGAIDEDLLDALYRRAFATILTSRYEGFGLPALEAMARACPVVVPSDGALAEVVADGGEIVAPAGMAFADVITGWLTDDAARAEASKRAVERASWFSIERSMAAHIEAYRRALAA